VAAASATLAGVLVLSPALSGSPVGAATPASAVISTLAGGGTAPGPPSGPAATIGQQPAQMTVHAGDLYLADPSFNAVRRIDLSTDTESVVAGSGVAGSTGDGGPALAAELSSPGGVGVDTAGDVFVADTGNGRVRMVAAGSSSPFLPGQTLTPGDIYTVAGGGLSTGSGVGDGGPALAAYFGEPSDVVVDPTGNLVVADTDDEAVRLVAATASDPLLPGQTLVPGDVYLLAGDDYTLGSPVNAAPATSDALNFPTGVALTATGNLVISNGYEGQIALVAAATSDPLLGSATLVPGDLYVVSSGTFLAPSGLAGDASGGLLVSDVNESAVRLIAGSTSDPELPGQTLVPTHSYLVAGTGHGAGYSGDGGPATSALLYDPEGVALDPATSTVYIGDTANYRIRTVTPSTGDIETYAGTGLAYEDGVASAESSLNRPTGVTVDSQGDRIIADTGDGVIRLIAGGTSSPLLPGQTLVAGDIYTVAGNGQEGIESGDGGPDRQASLSQPTSVVLDSAGNLLVADSLNDVVRLVAATDADPFLPGRSLTPGDIYLVAGTPQSPGFGGDDGPATSAQFDDPTQLAIDGAGNLVIADTDNGRVRLLAATGTADPLAHGQALTAGDVYTVAGGGTPASGDGDGGPATGASFAGPAGLALTSAGNLVVADEYDSEVRLIATATSDPLLAGRTLTVGDIYDVAGIAGHSGSSGEDGPATSANLDQPVGLAVDPAGNLYIADSADNEIQAVAVGTTLPIRPDLTSTTPDDLYLVAGGGSGFGGDGGPPVDAGMSSPSGVLAPSTGQVLILDTGNNRLRMAAITPSPPQSLTATPTSDSVALTWQAPATAGGSPVTGYAVYRAAHASTEDLGGPPLATVTGTSFTDTTAVNGSTYFYEVTAETAFGPSPASNEAVATPEGALTATITTIGGGGLGLPGGTATAIGQAPTAVAVSGSTAYISDSVHTTIRALNLSTGQEASFAGNGTTVTGSGVPATSAGFGATPTGLVVDPSGNVLAVDTAAALVHLIAEASSDPLMPGQTLTVGDVYTLAGGGTGGTNGVAATAAALSQPSSVAVDAAGNLYVTEALGEEVLMVAAHTSAAVAPGQTLVAGDIYRVAGGGATSPANGIVATTARLAACDGAVVDSHGNLVFSDTGDEAVRLVAGSTGDPLLPGLTLTAGRLYTVAGNGVFGVPSSGVVATSSDLGLPYGLAVDPAGSLVITDPGKFTVQLVAGATSDPLLPGKTLMVGDIYLLAGKGLEGYSGDNGLATAAELNGTDSVAVTGAGDLLLADNGNNRLRQVATGTGIITTVAGDGLTFDNNIPALDTTFYRPHDVVTDALGNLYVADAENSQVRVLAEATSSPFLPGSTLVPGDVYAVAGTGVFGSSTYGGPAGASPLESPVDEAIDPSGNLVFSDSAELVVDLVAATTSDPLLPGQTLTPGDLYRVAGNGLGPYAGGYGDAGNGGSAPAATLYTPLGLAVLPSGDLVIGVQDTYGSADYVTNVRLVAAGTSSPFVPGQTLVPGDIYPVAGATAEGYSGDGGPATGAEMNGAGGFAVDASGNLLVADTANHVLRLIAGGTSDALLPDQTLVAGDIYTVAGRGNQIPGGSGTPASGVDLLFPDKLAVDPAGNVVMADSGENLVDLLAQTTADPLVPGVTLVPGDVYKVAGIVSSGYSGDGGPATAAALSEPTGFTSTPTGDLVVADSINDVVRKITVPVVVGPPSLPEATLDQPYDTPLSATGGTAPYTFTLTSGTLPPGVSLQSGVLSGTPTKAATSTFTVQATDADGRTGSRSYTLVVVPATTLSGPAEQAVSTAAALSGTGQPSATVTLFSAAATGSFTVAATVKAKATGAFAFSPTITEVTRFYAKDDGASSPVVTVGTNPTLSGPTSATKGTEITLTGAARPGATVTILEAKNGGSFSSVGTRVASTPAGRYTFKVKVTAASTAFEAEVGTLVSTRLTVTT